MRGLMPNSLTKLSESTEEDEVLRSRKRKLDMGAESDGEQLREQLRLHLEDKRILNGDAGKRLRRDFEFAVQRRQQLGHVCKAVRNGTETGADQRTYPREKYCRRNCGSMQRDDHRFVL